MAELWFLIFLPLLFHNEHTYTCLFTVRIYSIYCLTCHNTDSELILEGIFIYKKL